jgi:hypothetical protein
MNRIQNVIEPQRLFLSWQRAMAGKERRSRRIVGEIARLSDGAVFRYLTDREDFSKAQGEGFQGFPAFKIGKSETFTTGVLDAFLRRLPPRKREDFAEYLAQYRLPESFSGSDMALLAYTGARLPGDGFEIIPDLAGLHPPLELVMEVAGFRHQEVAANTLAVGDALRLVPEPDNPIDPEAIAVIHDRGLIGYIPRPYCPAVAGWLGGHSVDVSIDRINGKPERPLVYLFVRVL